MKKLTVFLAMVFSFMFCLSCLVGISHAQSKEDAVKMVNDAINYIKTNGKEKAYKDITDGKEAIAEYTIGGALNETD